MFRSPLRPFRFLRRRTPVCRCGLMGAGVVALMLATAGSAFSRPPHSDQDGRGRRQIEDTERAEIRRSLGRSDEELRPDAYRERRRMSEAERQSLRDAVRDAYGDRRDRPRR
jgi:hypothetical protein